MRYLPAFMTQVFSSGRHCVNVWGAVSAEGLGPLVRLPPNFNADSYCDLLEHYLLPYVLDGPFKDGIFLLQQDYSPAHTMRKVKALLEERAVRLLEWTPKGADLNIIENVWGYLKSRISRCNYATTADDLDSSRFFSKSRFWTAN